MEAIPMNKPPSSRTNRDTMREKSRRLTLLSTSRSAWRRIPRTYWKQRLSTVGQSFRASLILSLTSGETATRKPRSSSSSLAESQTVFEGKLEGGFLCLDKGVSDISYCFRGEDMKYSCLVTYRGFVLVESSKVQHLVCCCQCQDGEKTQPTFEGVTSKPPHFEGESLD